MNMDARIIAAEGIYNATSSGVLFPWETLDDKSREHMGIMADGALTALKMSGYAIVKLPEPMYQRGGKPGWSVFLDGEPEDVYLGDKGGIVLSGIETFEENDIPELAATLLAAHAETEAAK